MKKIDVKQYEKREDEQWVSNYLFKLEEKIDDLIEKVNEIIERINKKK